MVFRRCRFYGFYSVYSFYLVYSVYSFYFVYSFYRFYSPSRASFPLI